MVTGRSPNAERIYNGAVITVPNVVKLRTIKVMLIQALCTKLWNYMAWHSHFLCHLIALHYLRAGVMPGHGAIWAGSTQSHPCEELEWREAACILWSLRAGFMPFVQEGGGKKLSYGKLCCGVVVPGIWLNVLSKSNHKESRRLVNVQETQLPWPSLPLRSRLVVSCDEVNQRCLPLFLWRIQVVLPMAVTWSASSLKPLPRKTFLPHYLLISLLSPSS